MSAHNRFEMSPDIGKILYDAFVESVKRQDMDLLNSQGVLDVVELETKDGVNRHLLKACKFCGISAAKLYTGEKEFMSRKITFYMVWCKECHRRTRYAATPEEAVYEWNNHYFRNNFEKEENK